MKEGINILKEANGILKDKLSFSKSNSLLEVSNLENLPTSKLKKVKKIPPQIRRKRRQAANARERLRMKNLNAAFDTLRNYLPTIDDNRQLSKQDTLQMAQSYILELKALLD